MNNYTIEAKELIQLGKYTYALASLYRALSLAEIVGDKRKIIDIILNIAQTQHDLGHSEQVIEWAGSALEQPLEIEDKVTFINLLFLNLLKRGNFDQAYSVLHDLMEISDSFFKPNAYMNLGIFNLYLSKYLKQHKLDLAETYFKKALKLVGEDEEKRTQIRFYLAHNLFEEGLFYTAGEHYLDILQSAKSIGFQIQILNELGKINFKLLDYDEAWKYLERARDLAFSHSHQIGLSYNIYYRGLFYMDLFQFENASTHLLTALYELLKHKQYSEVSAVYLSLAKLCESHNSARTDDYFSKYESYLKLLNPLADNMKEIIFEVEEFYHEASCQKY